MTQLNVHAIVHPSNEHLNDKNPLSDEIFNKGGPALEKEVREDIRSKSCCSLCECVHVSTRLSDRKELFD